MPSAPAGYDAELSIEGEQKVFVFGMSIVIASYFKKTAFCILANFRDGLRLMCDAAAYREYLTGALKVHFEISKHISIIIYLKTTNLETSNYRARRFATSTRFG